MTTVMLPTRSETRMVLMQHPRTRCWYTQRRDGRWEQIAGAVSQGWVVALLAGRTAGTLAVKVICPEVTSDREKNRTERPRLKYMGGFCAAMRLELGYPIVVLYENGANAAPNYRSPVCVGEPLLKHVMCVADDRYIDVTGAHEWPVVVTRWESAPGALRVHHLGAAAWEQDAFLRAHWYDPIDPHEITLARDLIRSAVRSE